MGTTPAGQLGQDLWQRCQLSAPGGPGDIDLQRGARQGSHRNLSAAVGGAIPGNRQRARTIGDASGDGLEGLVLIGRVAQGQRPIELTGLPGGWQGLQRDGVVKRRLVVDVEDEIGPG